MNREQLEGAKKLFFILLGIDIAATAIVGLNAFSTVGILWKVQSGARNVDQSMISSLEFWDGFSKLLFLTLVGVGLGLVKWLNACYSFAKQTIGATGFKNEGWTATGWIIPIFNLFKPYQIINEIYKAGSSNYTATDDWKKKSGSGALLTWWIFWAVTHIIMWMMFKMTMSSTFGENATMRGAIMATEVQAWTCVVSLAVAGLWFWVVNLLTQRLLDRGAVSAKSLSQQNVYQSPAVGPTSGFSTVTTSPVSVAPAVQPSSGASKAESSPSVSTQAFVIDEDAIYAVIANELKTGTTNDGLWTRLFAECDGDENRTKVAYIKQRAEKLIAMEKLRLADQLAYAQVVAAQLATAGLAGQEVTAKFDAEAQETAMRLGVSLNDASAVVRHNIAIDGKQFRYGDYRYDRLSDAIAYATRVGSSPATISSAVQNSPVTQVSLQHQPEQPASLRIRSPNESEVAALAASANVTNEHAREMLLFGVSKAYDKFVYQTYRYDRVADALNYARADQRHA